ncbi:MAG: exo-alpha-sialidase, partial [Verrucomicrobiales bacterium]|nr:exo-alpha-sialidase [Verrucomicrobiales bacterium]
MTNPISRRRFTGISLAASTALLAPRRVSAAPAMELLDTKIISPQTNYYHGWPTLTRLEKG